VNCIFLIPWIAALVVVLAKGGSSPDSPPSRGKDALIVQITALGFFAAAIVAFVMVGAWSVEDAGSAGTTFVLAYLVLNIWGLVCAVLSGLRGEPRKHAVISLAVSIAPLVVAQVIVVVIIVMLVARGGF